MVIAHRLGQRLDYNVSWFVRGCELGTRNMSDVRLLAVAHID